jgi:hypothetical protein
MMEAQSVSETSEIYSASMVLIIPDLFWTVSENNLCFPLAQYLLKLVLKMSTSLYLTACLQRVMSHIRLCSLGCVVYDKGVNLRYYHNECMLPNVSFGWLLLFPCSKCTTSLYEFRSFRSLCRKCLNSTVKYAMVGFCCILLIWLFRITHATPCNRYNLKRRQTDKECMLPGSALGPGSDRRNWAVLASPRFPVDDFGEAPPLPSEFKFTVRSNVLHPFLCK